MAQDKFPQFEVASIQIAVANTQVRVAVNFPNDLTDGEVLELTDIIVAFGMTSVVEQPAAASEMQWEIDVGTRDDELAFTDPDLIYRISQALQLSDITAESGSVAYDTTIHKKLTDGRGNGMLVPAEKLYVGFDTNNYAGTPKAFVRVYYRIARVSEREILEFLTSA